ncbi:hypothetical protein ABPG72_018606 [Tetrahymena utriculariae]
MERKHLNDFTKGFIIGASQQGASVKDILSLLEENNLVASKTTIYDLINEYKLNQRLSTPKKSIGRPKLLGEETGNKFLMEIEDDRNITAMDIYNNKKINHNNVSYQTINNFINQSGYEARIKKTKLSLSENNVEQRYDYALNIQQAGEKFVNKIFFSDESKLYAQRSGQDYARKQKNEDWSEREEFYSIQDKISQWS